MLCQVLPKILIEYYYRKKQFNLKTPGTPVIATTTLPAVHFMGPQKQLFGSPISNKLKKKHS